jgi:hypothetical protein
MSWRRASNIAFNRLPEELGHHPQQHEEADQLDNQDVEVDSEQLEQSAALAAFRRAEQVR